MTYLFIENKKNRVKLLGQMRYGDKRMILLCRCIKLETNVLFSIALDKSIQSERGQVDQIV